MFTTREQIANFVDQQIAALAIAPANRETIINYLARLPGKVSDFGEGRGELSQEEVVEAIRQGVDLDTLADHKRIVKYSQDTGCSYSEGYAAIAGLDVSRVDESQFDAESLKQHRQIEAYARSHNCDYSEAIAALQICL